MPYHKQKNTNKQKQKHIKNNKNKKTKKHTHKKTTQKRINNVMDRFRVNCIP